MVTSTIATGVIFIWLIDPDYGLVNAALNKRRVCPQPFFASTSQALYVDRGDDDLGLDRVRP